MAVVDWFVAVALVAALAALVAAPVEKRAQRPLRDRVRARAAELGKGTTTSGESKEKEGNERRDGM